jgi:hypothetical protein
VINAPMDDMFKELFKTFNWDFDGMMSYDK